MQVCRRDRRQGFSPAVWMVIVTLGMMGSPAAIGGEDTAPPVLKQLTITPRVIDTSAGPAEVILGFTVTDDASGVNYAEAVFADPSGALPQSTSVKFAPTLSGSPAAKVIFPRFSAAGVWTLAKVFLSDVAGNTLLLDTEALAGMGFPTRVEVKSAQDTTSPKLRRLEFSPSRIDTSLAAAEVKVSFEATDDLAGVTHVELAFASPTGRYQSSGPVKFDALRSVTGAVIVKFPRHSEAGQWSLRPVYVADAANNTLLLQADDLQSLGIPTTLEVISTQDTDPPRLTSLRFTPESIDTSAGPATVNVAFRATSKVSGVTSMEVVFDSPSGVSKQRVSATFPALNGVGDSLKITFPHLSEPGQWSLSGVLMADASGNTLALDVEGLESLGIARRLNVTSATDSTPPVLTSLSLSAQAIEVSRGPATVDLTLKATDDLSGIKEIEAYFVSPSGLRQRVSDSLSQDGVPKREVSRTLRVHFPQSSERGDWRLDSLILTDVAGNTLTLEADALSRFLVALQVR